jgi:transcriptional regulator of met regulon
MKPILLAALALSLPLALPLSAVAADGPDDLWEITMKMEMAGMPMSMPAQTNTVCTPKGSPDDRMVPMDKSCKLIEQKRTASRLTFRYTCKDERSIYTGSGEMEFQGKDAYKGKMHAVGMMEGEQVDMTNTWSGKRLGNCTYEDPAKKVEQYRAASNAQIAKACDEAMEALATQLFFGDSAICKERKAEFCARAGKIADELQRDPAAFKRHAQKDWRGAMKACGKDPEPIVAKACVHGAGEARRRLPEGLLPGRGRRGPQAVLPGPHVHLRRGLRPRTVQRARRAVVHRGCSGRRAAPPIRSRASATS